MVHDAQTATTFESFFHAEFPRLVSILTAWSGDRATAEDLAQDALLRAEADWARVSALDKPGAWVRRVALNRSSNERRRRNRRDRAMQRLGPSDHQAGVDPPDESLWDAVRLLPDRQRIAIVLHHVDDLALADIAVVLGCSEGSVKTHLQRGRQRLARILTEEVSS